MDYGKTAYAKLQELEAYIKATAQKKENRNSAVKSSYPHAAFDRGYEPATLYGSGCVGITVTLGIRAPQGADNVKVTLYLGDKPVSYVNVRLAANSSAQYTLTGAVYPGDGERIKLTATDGCIILDSVTVYAEGNGVNISDGGDGYKCDEYGGEVYTLNEDSDGYIVLRNVNDGTTVDVMHGSTFDLAAFDGLVHVVCCDDNGNLWGLCYDVGLNEISRKYLGEGFDRVAVGQAFGGMQLVAVRNRKIYCAECCKSFLGLTDWVPVDFESDADEVYLSKQTVNPVLFFSRGGQIFAKLPEDCARSYDCISLEFGVEFSE